MLRSFERGEWRLAPDQEAERERAREIARNTMATWSEEQLAEVQRRAAARSKAPLIRPRPLPAMARPIRTGDNGRRRQRGLPPAVGDYLPLLGGDYDDAQSGS